MCTASRQAQGKTNGRRAQPLRWPAAAFEEPVTAYQAQRYGTSRGAPAIHGLELPYPAKDLKTCATQPKLHRLSAFTGWLEIPGFGNPSKPWLRGIQLREPPRHSVCTRSFSKSCSETKSVQQGSELRQRDLSSLLERVALAARNDSSPPRGICAWSNRLGLRGSCLLSGLR